MVSKDVITSYSIHYTKLYDLTNVELNEEEIRRIVKTTNGCLAWGGGVNLAPADDIIINVERPVSIDPQPQLLASVMAKKIATGIKYTVVITSYSIHYTKLYEKFIFPHDLGGREKE